MDEDARTTGMGLWTDANEMLLAAKHLASVPKLRLSQPIYYLLGHSIELSFKCFLRSKGASLRDLRRIGHDLILGHERAESAGLSDLIVLTDRERAIVSLLNSYYKAKEFEYRVVGFKTYPEVDELIGVLERLLSSTRAFCARSVLNDA